MNADPRYILYYMLYKNLACIHSTVPKQLPLSSCSKSSRKTSSVARNNFLDWFSNSVQCIRPSKGKWDSVSTAISQICDVMWIAHPQVIVLRQQEVYMQWCGWQTTSIPQMPFPFQFLHLHQYQLYCLMRGTVSMVWTTWQRLLCSSASPNSRCITGFTLFWMKKFQEVQF